ncbi:CU044_5270 family protein [Actinoplanes sp. CA-015351]|uniref:CU044_5270 family protein n=1 Tax=Actinoplanes sp. CA-015351 TaxID=3239897 RepID=UPI003D98719B
MNDTSPHHDDLTELARLLPPAGDPRMTAGRHHELRAHLLAEIGPVAPAPRRRWVFAAVPIAAGVLAVAIAGGFALRSSLMGEGFETAPVIQVVRGEAGAAAFLDRVALMAAATPDIGVAAGQYVYIKSRVAWTSAGDGEAPRLAKVHDREIWLPVSDDGDGLVVERGKRIRLEDAISNARAADLPTDPDVLLEKIYKDTAGQGNSRAGRAFTFIGDTLAESVLDPELNAALYRAAAKIPGVVLVPDSVDATGRSGIAVAFVESGERTEWIFDRATLEYLGERSYLVEDTDAGRAGMLTATTAVTGRAVVGELGERP